MLRYQFLPDMAHALPSLERFTSLRVITYEPQHFIRDCDRIKDLATLMPYQPPTLRYLNDIEITP
jgi:hypothetical protein